VSSKWGFTKWEKDEFTTMRGNGLLIPDGVNVQYKPAHGPLKAWMARQ